MRKAQVAMALLASLSIFAASCGDDEKSDSTAAPTTVAEAPDETTGDTTADTSAPDTTPGEVDYMWTPNADLLAGAEGQVNIVAWAGYIEDGSTDPAYDWVTPFTEMTGCAVNTKLGNSSDEMVQLMQSGEYDGVSASGDATQRLISGGEVAEIDVAEYSSYENIFEQLKLQPWNSVDGVPFGIPHGRGANLLVYNTEAFADSAPDSWSAMFEAGGPADGAVSVYDSPIYIADAALYLMAHNPELGITNPYALDQTQFDAAVALLEQQAALTSQYWALYTDQQASLEDGSVLAGTTWQVIVNLAQGNGALIDAVKPVEGATGWSDTWMLASNAANPNCMKLWMDWIASPWANAQVAVWFGEAPSNALACTLADMADHCATFHAEEDDYWSDVWYWTTATEQCLDGRNDVTCVGYTEWVNAWTALRA
ncbi:MAG: spermidine/putrescine ABC transporter substrate-binding protein [Actinomycetia bacterium]|nr:spermidine/putrescine ABC transporter substrate-binding protein [Actinomycetes bacterium]